MVLLAYCILICWFLNTQRGQELPWMNGSTFPPKSTQTVHLPVLSKVPCNWRCMDSPETSQHCKRANGLPNLGEFGGRNSPAEALVVLRLLQFTQMKWTNRTCKQTWSSIYTLQSATHPTKQAPEEKTHFKRSLSFRKPSARCRCLMTSLVTHCTF